MSYKCIYCSSDEPHEFECASCGFLACCKDEEDKFKWVSDYKGIEDMMSEDELRSNSEIVGEVLSQGAFYCSWCAKTA